MRVREIAALLAVTDGTVTAVLMAKYGAHSTPGIWSAPLSLPGMVIGAAAGLNNDWLAICIAAFVNWLFYWAVLAAIGWLLRRYKRRRDVPA